jgi:ATP-binding cassette subfamily F protein 3
MIQVEGVAKGYAGQQILADLSWRIPDRERIGLVGPNGAGKTTLCRLLAAIEEPDEGRIVRPRETTVGYLPQEAAGNPEGSVLGEVLGGFADVWQVEREMEDIAARLAAASAADSDALTARYGDLQHRFEALGGYRLETEAKAILSGLGFRPADFTRALSEFSGGWRMRAMLARLLAAAAVAPAARRADQPPRHRVARVARVVSWSTTKARSYSCRTIAISLNRMVTSIAELAPSGSPSTPATTTNTWSSARRGASCSRRRRATRPSVSPRSSASSSASGTRRRRRGRCRAA